MVESALQTNKEAFVLLNYKLEDTGNYHKFYLFVAMEINTNSIM